MSSIVDGVAVQSLVRVPLQHKLRKGKSRQQIFSWVRSKQGVQRIVSSVSLLFVVHCDLASTFKVLILNRQIKSQFIIFAFCPHQTNRQLLDSKVRFFVGIRLRIGFQSGLDNGFPQKSSEFHGDPCPTSSWNS